MDNEDIYQEFIIELYRHPVNLGTISDADLKAEVFNATCGDRITLYLKVKNGLVADAKFMGEGCAISQASASLFTGFLKGKRLDQLGKITKNDVLGLIKIDLSKNPTRMRCALLVLDATKKAIGASRTKGD